METILNKNLPEEMIIFYCSQRHEEISFPSATKSVLTGY